MARRKKGKCKWGRRKDGLCRKRPRGRRRAASKSRKQAKPTPLFADIVRHARAGQRYQCDSPDRTKYIGSAVIAIGNAERALASMSPSDAARAARIAGLNRAKQQIIQAKNRGCAAFYRKADHRAARALAQKLSAASGWPSGSGLGPTANQSHLFTEPTPPSRTPPSGGGGGGGSPPRNPPPSPFDPGSIRPPPDAAGAMPRMRKDLKQLYFDWAARNPSAGATRDAFVKAPPKISRVHTFQGDKLEIVRSNTGGTLRIRKPTSHRNQKNPRVIEPLHGEFVVLRENKKNGQATVMRRADYDRHLHQYFRNVAYVQKHGPLRRPPSPVPIARRTPSPARRSSHPALDPMNLHTPMPSSMPVLEPGVDPFSVPPNWPPPRFTVVPEPTGPTGPYGQPRPTRPAPFDPGQTGEGDDDPAQ